MLKRLREKGYVRVASCAGDDRLKLLFATEKGEQVRAFLETAIRDVQQQVYGCFSEQSCARLTVCKRNCFKISASAQKIISGIKRRNPIYENCIASAWPV